MDKAIMDDWNFNVNVSMLGLRPGLLKLRLTFFTAVFCIDIR